MSTKTTLFVVEKDYSTSRLKGDHDSDFKWIDERVFSENDPHRDADGLPLSAKDAALAELARLRSTDRPDYIRGYRLIQRTVTTQDKVLTD
jgi:hypothetical protein